LAEALVARVKALLVQLVVLAVVAVVEQTLKRQGVLELLVKVLQVEQGVLLLEKPLVAVAEQVVLVATLHLTKVVQVV
jgi:hypothetical protein